MKNIYRLRITMIDDFVEPLGRISFMLPDWHCFKGFLDVCLEEFKHKKEIHNDTDYADVPIGSITFGVDVTLQQLEFLRSDMAKFLLTEYPGAEEFYRQLSECTLKKFTRAR